ncbi:unnamed protein product [Protopolystoma xenopodis]|uniref:Uncharacterized protein n=1 Tax=Protopolystoma xenopodis TaxID=117903 RepID=A0A3S5A4G7_9PLAT|nr:unnamed protein product [Protopolystoma xenopodis]
MFGSKNDMPEVTTDQLIHPRHSLFPRLFDSRNREESASFDDALAQARRTKLMDCEGPVERAQSFMNQSRGLLSYWGSEESTFDDGYLEDDEGEAFENEYEEGEDYEEYSRSAEGSACHLMRPDMVASDPEISHDFIGDRESSEGPSLLPHGEVLQLVRRTSVSFANLTSSESAFQSPDGTVGHLKQRSSACGIQTFSQNITNDLDREESAPSDGGAVASSSTTATFFQPKLVPALGSLKPVSASACHTNRDNSHLRTARSQFKRPRLRHCVSAEAAASVTCQRRQKRRLRQRTSLDRVNQSILNRY